MPTRPLSDELCQQALDAERDCAGNQVAAAQKLGVNHATFRSRVRVAKQRGMKPTPLTEALKPIKPARKNYYSHVEPRKNSAWIDKHIKDGIVLVFSDAHFWPGVRTTAFRGLLYMIEQLKPSMIVCNGDAFDGASISRHARIGWDSKPTVIEEIKACQQRLGEIEDAAGKAELIWPLGNHCARFETFLASNAPQYEGVPGFTLKDHFPRWSPCWALRLNDEVVIKHRYKGGIHATHNNTVNAGTTMVTGHLHSLKVTPFDDYRGTRWGVDTGTLAEADGPQFVDYLEANPTNWRSGFAVLSFRDGQLLWPELVNARRDGLIDFRGHLFDVSGV